SAQEQLRQRASGWREFCLLRWVRHFLDADWYFRPRHVAAAVDAGRWSGHRSRELTFSLRLQEHIGERMKRIARLLFVCFSMLLRVWASKEATPPILPVQGVVMLNGAPLPRASVRFLPQTQLGSEFIAVGVTDDQGKYTLQCKGQPGACAGENMVLVAEGEI